MQCRAPARVGPGHTSNSLQLLQSAFTPSYQPWTSRYVPDRGVHCRTFALKHNLLLLPVERRVEEKRHLVLLTLLTHVLHTAKLGVGRSNAIK